jgi:protein TonB
MEGRMFTRGGRRRRWGISSGTSLVTHLMFGAAASLLTTARFEPANSNGQHPSEEGESIPIDLVPFAEAAPESPPSPAPLPPPPAPRPRRAAAVDVRPPSAPPHEEELVDIAEVDSGEGGTLAGDGTLYRTISVAAHARPAVVTAPGEQPPAITASEAAYLRTYETFPNLPASLWVAGRNYVVTAQICVSADGRVSGVAIKDGSARDLEQVITTSVRSWRYEPRFIGGQARPFCHLIRFVYSVRR